MTYEVKEDPQGRDNHWIVNGQLVAGAKTSDEAIDIVKSLNTEHEIAITVDMVRNECERRMIQLTGARDSKHLSVIISNSTREGLALEHIRLGTPNPLAEGWLVEPREWTQDEKLRAYELQQANIAIDHIRLKSNELEATNPIPDNFRDDQYWA